MEEADQRAALSALIARDGASLSTLSRAVGRNAAWVQQYLRRGTPRLLPERERALLAAFFGVPESRLGGSAGPSIVNVPQLEIAVSAGPGRFAATEAAIASAGYAADDLARLGIASGNAAILTVAGDSMAPTLQDGDRILIDRGQTHPRSNGAIWVIRIGEELLVKRLSRDGKSWRVLSDNAPDRIEPLDALDVLGRVMQLIRSL